MYKFGCGGKLAYRRLEQIIHKSRISSDAKFGSDAPQCSFGEGYVASIDTIFSFEDDFRNFGRLAIAHSASDIYSVGAKPLHANISLQVATDLPDEKILQVLDGVKYEMNSQGIEFGKGHTTIGQETCLTVSVIGSRRSPQKKLELGTEYAIILTKEIGLTALYLLSLADHDYVASDQAVHELLRENLPILDSLADSVEGTTDVTGYGLLNTLEIMAKRLGLTIELSLSSIPRATNPFLGVYPGCLYESNFRDSGQGEIGDATLRMALFSGEVCGAIAMLVRASEAAMVVSHLHLRGFRSAAVIAMARSGSGLVTMDGTIK